MMVRCDCRTCGRYKRNNCPFQTFKKAAKAEITRLTIENRLLETGQQIRIAHETGEDINDLTKEIDELNDLEMQIIAKNQRLTKLVNTKPIEEEPAPNTTGGTASSTLRRNGYNED